MSTHNCRSRPHSHEPFAWSGRLRRMQVLSRLASEGAASTSLATRAMPWANLCHSLPLATPCQGAATALSSMSAYCTSIYVPVLEVVVGTFGHSGIPGICFLTFEMVFPFERFGKLFEKKKHLETFLKGQNQNKHLENKESAHPVWNVHFLWICCAYFLFFQGFNISSSLVRKECRILTALVGLEEPLPLGPSVHASFVWETGPWTLNQLSNLLPTRNHHQSRKRCREQKLLFNVIKKISVENSFHCIPFPTALSFENKDSTLPSPQAWPKAFLSVMCHLNSTNFTLPAVSLTFLVRSTVQGRIC